MKKYKKEAAYLHETGGGVKSESDGNDWKVYMKMSFYVPATGPHEDTVLEHLNLWSEPSPCIYLLFANWSIVSRSNSIVIRVFSRATQAHCSMSQCQSHLPSHSYRAWGLETYIIQPLEEDNFLPEQLDLIPDALEMLLDDQVNRVAITFDNQKSMPMIFNEIKINQATQGMGPPAMPQDCMAAVPGMPLPSHGSASVGSCSQSEIPKISLANTGAKGSSTSSSIKKGKLLRTDKCGPKPSTFNIKKL